MFPDENLSPADFLRQEGDIGYFQTPDGSRVSVDLRQSPYARQIAAQAMVDRSAQGQALDVPSQPLAPTGARTAPAIPSGIATTAPAIPAASRPMTAPAAPAVPAPAAPPPQTPEELRRQYAFAQMMPAFQGPQPPQPAPPPRFIGTPTQYDIAGMSQAFAQPTPTPAQFQEMTAPPAVAAAPVGAPSAQAPGQPMRIRAPQPSLDALMVPQGYSPGLIDELAGGTPGSRSMDRREALIGREAELLAQRADAAAAAAEAERDAIDASASRALEIERDRRSAMSDAQRRFQRSVDALGAMREDPARLLRSAAGGVSAAIAIGLGAAGAALAGGGENTALSIVQRNIDRDIAAQRTDIQTAGTAAEAQRSVLGLMRQEFSDQTAAETAARSAMLSAAAAQAQRVTAGLDNRTAQLRGEQMVQQLRDESATAAAQAQAQEAEAQLQRRLLEARVQRAELANIGTARRLQGGPGRPRATTAPQARVYNATFDSLDPSIPDAERRRIASEASGIPMSVAGALAGGRFAEGAAEETPRAVTTATMGAYNQLRESGATHAAALAAAGLPANTPAPSGGRFASPQDDQVAGTVSALSAALDRIDLVVNPRGIPAEDVPGIGTIESMVPYSMLSQTGRNLRNEITNTVDLIGRLRSGGAISVDEGNRFAQILEGAGTEADLRAGIARIRAEIAARQTRSGQSVEERAMSAQPSGMLGVR